MTGAIAGGIIGAPYEGAPIKTKQFPLSGEGSRFTDDAVLTAAIAQALLDDEDCGAAPSRLGGAACPDQGSSPQTASSSGSSSYSSAGSCGSGRAAGADPSAGRAGTSVAWRNRRPLRRRALA